MPFFTQQWEDVLSCSVCNRRFDVVRIPTSLVCGHTVCSVCISSLHLGTSTTCPLDQVDQKSVVAFLPPNTAMLELLQLDWRHSVAFQHRSIMSGKLFSGAEERKDYELTIGLLETLAQRVVASPVVNKSLQRKLLTLLQCQIFLEEGRTRAVKASRSICERIVMELILLHQNMQQLTTHLWSAVRARGCQFLGPAMQEEVLKLVLLALETGTALSRKVLVMFIVQKLKPQYAQASKTSVGHVVQLLYRASCFKVSKRDGDSSLMELKDEFRTYEALRREHDTQIIQIAQEAGLRIAPEQWSALLYGDQHHKSAMQSIIDKLQTNQSFPQSVQELLIAIQRSGDPDSLNGLKEPLDFVVIFEAEIISSITLQHLSLLFSHLLQVVTIYLHFLTEVAQARENSLHSRSRKAHLTHSPSFPILDDRTNQMNLINQASMTNPLNQFNQPHVSAVRNFHQPLTASRSLPPADALSDSVRSLDLNNGTNRHAPVFRQSPLVNNTHRGVPSFPSANSSPSFPRQASRMQSSPLQTLNHLTHQGSSPSFFSTLNDGRQYESCQEFSASAGNSPRSQTEAKSFGSTREFFCQPLSTTWSTPNCNLKFVEDAKAFSLDSHGMFKTSMSSSTLMEDFKKWRDDTPSSNGMHRISSFSDHMSTSDSSFGSDGFRAPHAPLTRQYASFGSSPSGASQPFRSLVSHGGEATSSSAANQHGLGNGWFL